jgi:indole-3-glycerol phosphate synthase
MILDDIVARKLKDLVGAKSQFPFAALKKRVMAQSKPKDFAGAIKGEGIKLIAEVKKASPSKGIIAASFDPLKLARLYAQNGAAAISVLTEQHFFLGDLSYLESIRESLGNSRPALLRKDFIFDPYQVYESRAHGADAILLIVAILKQEELPTLLNLTHELQMKALVEVHSEEEVGIALNCGAGIIGINNRNLADFSVDLSTSEKLRKKIPADKIVVSESGIRVHGDIERLRQCGVNAVLIGEALVASNDIPAKIKELL